MLIQRRMLVVAAVLTISMSPLTGNGQSITSTDSPYAAQQTPWGHPDLQGVWDRRTITQLERPQRFADKAFLNQEEILAYEKASAARADGVPLDARGGLEVITVHDPGDLDFGSTVLASGQTSLIVDPANGRIPGYTQTAVDRMTARATAREGRGPADSWIDRSLIERCITWGIPQGMLPGPYNNNIQILQTADTVMILNEMIHDIRIVPLDGRPHLPEKIGQWHGDPRGHWEGATLVVESTNFSEKTNFRRSSEKLLLVERFTRIAADMLQYEFTVEDPSAWVQPWSVAFPMVLADQPIYEFACHEGNYGLKNILRAARHLEQQTVEK
jgi:hypothetical protein